MKTQKRQNLFLSWMGLLLAFCGPGALAAPRPHDNARTAETKAEQERALVHHTTQANGILLHYVVAGRGEPLVLLHGFGETWYEWHDLIPALAARYTVIAPDLRGAGDSERPLAGYDKKTMAADIHELVRQLGFTKINLVGHDIGLMVAYAYAAAHPDEVRRLVLLDAPIPGVGDWETTKLGPHVWHFAFHSVSDLPEALVAGKERTYLTTGFYFAKAYNPAAFTEERITEYVRHYASPGGMRAGFAYFRAFPEDEKQNREYAKTKLTMPVLALGGAQSYGAGIVSLAQVVAENVTGGAIEQCGHWIPVERPQELTERLLAFCRGGAGLTGATSGARSPEFGVAVKPVCAEKLANALDKSLAQQIFETMIQAPGNRPGYRPVHAKGIVCLGTFTPSKEATALSRAAHFQRTVPITVRFSDGASDPSIPDNSPNAGPRGMAIRFTLPGGGVTDIVSMSHNGFVVGTGEEFLALQQAIVATDPGKPHPWPIEEFVGSHPLALKFVQENQVIPASFATAAFFSNDAFLFVNKKGVKQAGRYKILPVAGQQDLSDAEAKNRPDDFLMRELTTRLATKPIKYRLVVQLPHAGDPTDDPSLVWPDDRKTIEVGTISLTSVAADSAARDRELAFDPTLLTDGIALSDDPFPALRSSVYALSVSHRRQK